MDWLLDWKTVWVTNFSSNAFRGTSPLLFKNPVAKLFVIYSMYVLHISTETYEVYIQRSIYKHKSLSKPKSYLDLTENRDWSPAPDWPFDRANDRTADGLDDHSDYQHQQWRWGPRICDYQYPENGKIIIILNNY